MGDRLLKSFISKDTFIQKSILQDSIFLTDFFAVEFTLPTDDDKPAGNKPGIIKLANDLGLGEIGDNNLILSNKLSFNVTKISMPGHSVGLKRTELVGPQRFIFGKKEYSDLSISFLETADLKIKNFFKSWILKGFDEITGQRKFFPNDISATITVFPLLPDGSFIPTLDKSDFVCEIFGFSLPFSVNDYEYDYATSDTDLKQTEVKFAYRYHISQFEKTMVIPKQI